MNIVTQNLVAALTILGLMVYGLITIILVFSHPAENILIVVNKLVDGLQAMLFAGWYHITGSSIGSKLKDQIISNLNRKSE